MNQYCKNCDTKIGEGPNVPGGICCDRCLGIISNGRQIGKTNTQIKIMEIEKSKEEIRKFESGAVRDSEAKKEDYIETISWTAFKRYAEFMTGKKNRYGSGNFKKGIPIDAYERSLIRHITKYLINKFENGSLEKEEDHLCSMLFNIFGIIHEEERLKNAPK